MNERFKKEQKQRRKDYSFVLHLKSCHSTLDRRLVAFLIKMKLLKTLKLCVLVRIYLIEGK